MTQGPAQEGTAQERAPGRFSVRVPDSWYEFDLWRATRTGDLARLVDARVADVPALAPHRGAVLRLLRDVAADAERRGAVFCAAMAEPDGAEGTLLVAAMGFVTAGSPDPGENSVEAIAAQLSGTATEGDPGAGRRVRLVELAAGRGVRVQGIEPAAMAAGVATDCVTMQTILPVPGDATLVNLVLVSPNVELAEPLLDLFDAVTSTLHWVADEDLPDPDRAAALGRTAAPDRAAAPGRAIAPDPATASG